MVNARTANPHPPRVRASTGSVAGLCEGLMRLGLHGTEPIMVHSALSRVGWLEDGPATLLAALRKVAPAATLVVPAQTPNNSTTSAAFSRATAGLDDAGLAAYEAAMEGFDPDRTPSWGMGQFAEFVRTRPGAVRSFHPQASFAALGPRAAALMRTHDIDCHLGERSPLAALYAAHARVLLLGVAYESCTALHLAEHRLPWPPARQSYRCYVLRGGRRERREFVGAALDDSDFSRLGLALESSVPVRRALVGRAEARLVSMRNAVDFAVEWLTINRQSTSLAAKDRRG